MMFAIYVLLAWSFIGGLAAILMGRAIAVCGGQERDDAALAHVLRPLRKPAAQTFEAARKVA
jgi:hypothetical protein